MKAKRKKLYIFRMHRRQIGADLADAQDERYNWQRSIVDLMKLLKLDRFDGL